MTVQWTHRNHFEFGYDDELKFQNRISSRQKFTFRYGSVAHRETSWRRANFEAARQIRENFQGDLWILLSGGTDSEVCARAFLEAKIPVRFASLRYEDNLNRHDLFYAEKFARSVGQELHYFDLSVREFWGSSRLLDYVDPIRCVSPILACHLWLADQVPGVPIIAQGEPHLKKIISDDYVPGVSPYLPSEWYLVESERLCSLYRHFVRKNRPAVPGFFQYTPEQIYSFCFHNPIMEELVNNRLIGKLGTRTSKNAMVAQFYPELERREKFTGFEKIQDLHDEYRTKLAQRFPDSDESVRIYYQNLKARLLGKLPAQDS